METMQKGLNLSLLLVACLALAACSPTAASPSPTVVAATDSPVPATDTATVPAPSATDTQEPQPSATEAMDGPAEAISISSPASSAQVSSPVQVLGESDPTFEQNLVVAIYDAEGQELASGPTTIQADIGQRGSFSLELQFDISSQQPGRISVYETSAMDGGIVHLSSVDVTLAPDGQAQNAVAEAGPERIQIGSPEQGAQLGGGSFTVSGYSAYFFESTLGYVVCGQGGSGDAHQLCGRSDNVIGQGSIMIQSPDVGQPGPFEAEIEYSAEQVGPARIVLYATSPRDGGLIHVASRTVELSP